MILEKLLTSKYFSLSLLVALIVVVAMYVKKPCDVEGMEGVDLTPLAQELSEKPWSKHGGYKRWNNKFDRSTDAYVKNKLKKNGYHYTDRLGRSDETFEKYMKDDEGYAQVESKIPKPANLRQEYSRCRPCDCKSDSESD